MPTEFTEGDRIQIADREATAEEQKNAIFFNHFRNVIGSVQKVYATGDAAIEVELDSLPEDLEKRHLEVQEQMKTKWLDGLSEEARNRLSDKERDFRLHYTLLVPLKDILLAPDAVAAPRPVTPPIPAEAIPVTIEPTAELSTDASEDAEIEDADVAPREGAEQEDDQPRRKTLAELEAAEAEELERRAKSGE